MDIYVLDNELTRVRTVATSSECLSATEELELGKAGQLTLSLPISYKDTVKEMNILAIHDRDDRYRLYIVTNRNLNNYTLDIVGISYPNYALSRVGNVKDLRPNNRPLTELIPQILGNSGWTLNNVDENLPGYTGSFYYLSRLECLSQISEALACEFDFYVTIAKNTITGQFVDVLEMLGEDTNRRFEYGTNALEVVAEYDATEVYTQAVGRGKGEETGDGYGRRIEFTDVVWSKANGDPVDKPAGQNWVNDPYENYQLPGNKRPQKIIEFEEITDPNVLLEETYKWLLDNNHPKVQFKAKIVETGALNLGDRVQIIRPDLDIRYKTRVFKLTRNLLNENLTEVEFGDNIATTPMDKLNSITTQVNSTNQALQRVEEQITMIDADGNRITYGPDEPPVKKKGDMWYKTTPDGKTEMYIWNGETWELTIGDAIFDDLEKKVNDAMSDAEQAKEDANNARHNALNALEKANDANDATLQIYNNLSDLEDGLNTKFLQTDELIAMQANKIGIFYPDSGFQCGSVNKYYVDYSTGGTVQYATLNKLNDIYRLWIRGTGVPTGQNYGVKLKDLIAVDSSKELRFNFNYRLYWDSSASEGVAEVVVTEYTNDSGSFSVVKDNVITVSAQERLRWYSSTNTLQLQSQTTHIRVLYRNRNVKGDKFESSYTSVYLSNGTDNLSSSIISVANDNINLSVQKGDVINQINVSPEGILIDGNKIHITGATSIDNAAIQDAAIANLSASKLTAGTIDARTIKVINLDVNSLTGNKAQFLQAAFNSANSSTTINSQGILTKNDHMTTALNAGCLEFRDKNGELSGAFETKDWLLSNGLDDTLLLKVLGDRQFTIGLAYDRTKPNDISPAISFKRREERNWMFIEDHDFRIVSRDGYRLRPGSSMNYENNKIYPSLTNDDESVGILLGDKDLIFRDGYRDNAGSNQMSLNRIRSGQLDSLKTPTGGFTWTIKDGTINGNASLVLSGSATSNSNFIGMNNADIWLNASQSVYITDRSGSRYKLEDLRWGRMGQLELPDGSYKMKVISKTINGNNGIALSGTDGENFIALNNADIWLKAKYNIVFSDGYGNGITLDSLRSGRTGQLQTTSKNYKISIADSSINGNPALALSGTNKDNYIAINNADIYLKAKYNIYFDDGYGSGFTLNQLRQKVEKSASTLIADNGEIHLDSARVKGKQAKILADDEGACIAFADGTLMFRDLETDDWHTLSELLNNKGA